MEIIEREISPEIKALNKEIKSFVEACAAIPK